jgi:putative ABC transport system substrate-binding protein
VQCLPNLPLQRPGGSRSLAPAAERGVGRIDEGVSSGHQEMIGRPSIVSLLIAVVALLLAAPAAVEAQQTGPTVHTVGVLAPHDHYRDREYPAFLETLRSLGWNRDRNLRVLLRSAEGKIDRLPALAKELVDARVDVIVAINTPGSGAAVQATKRIPIVMALVGDPVAMGFVSNLARPGGNVTGISTINRELTAKRLALVKEAVPGATRIAAMFNPDDPLNTLQMEDVQRAAPALKIDVHFFPVKTPGELAETFKRIAAWRAEAALWLSGQSQALQPAAVKLALTYRLPVMGTLPGAVERGGLMSYSPDDVELFRRTALYVDRIFKGSKPGHLPVELPTKFALVINAKTAKALGLTIPPSVLARADQVIE